MTTILAKAAESSLDPPAPWDQPEWMLTLVQVLTAVGDSLVKAGYIQSYDPPRGITLEVIINHVVPLNVTPHNDPIFKC